MLLGELINENLINYDIKSNDKQAVIKEIADMFLKGGYVSDSDVFCKSIMNREEIESTAIGDGIAIPHGRSNTVKSLKVAFGKSSNGVNFNAADKKPVYIIFMIAAPIDARKEYLQAVAKIARLLKSRVMKEALLASETTKNVMKIIKDFDKMLIEDIRVETKEGRVIHK
ncbi:PTS sugar transporter subunit IIA [candidate division WOR-3 bacterium]|nr:PTS sugar transporter subunit IIA [candidate division WOR-3 bacterium]